MLPVSVLSAIASGSVLGLLLGEDALVTRSHLMGRLC